MRSKQEQAMSYLRAFSKKDAVTERQIYLTQKRLFSYDRHDRLFKALEELKPTITRENQGETKAWGNFVSIVYNLLNEPTCTRSLHSGNLNQIYKRNKYIHRFQSNGVWRYYLGGKRNDKQ